MDIPKKRRNDYDVTNTICVTDVDAVRDEVCRLFQQHYPHSSTDTISQAFSDFHRLFLGEYPNYYAIETPYHDLQHIMDTSLAMMRLLIGYNSAVIQQKRVGKDLAELGIIIALYHDVGFARLHGDEDTVNGAVHTANHVARGAEFLALYLPKLGLSDQIKHAEKLIHFTGYEVDISTLSMASDQHRLLGFMIGSADLIAQMSDRCYLEKCSERLYAEFVLAELARPETNSSDELNYVFDSKDDLMKQTVNFIQTTIDVRLNKALGGAHAYVASFFGGTNLYMHYIVQNQKYLDAQLKNGDWKAGLGRNAPWTLVSK